PVEWEARSRAKIAYADYFSSVTISGITKEQIKGKRYCVFGDFEVVPSGLIYFIDSGASEEAPQYKAIQDALGLKNDKFDQVYTEGSWGYIDDGMNFKGGTDINDIYSTGLWAGSNKDIIYKLPLEA